MSSRVPYPVTASATGDYRSFDRSTRAGRLLHNLYNPRTVDSTLDRDLLKRLEESRRAREAAAQPQPKPVPKSRAHVELPAPPPREIPKTLPPIGRRPLRLIEQNERDAAADSRLAEEAAVAARKPARTDEDKFRLQHRFQFGTEPSAKLLSAFNRKNGVSGSSANDEGCDVDGRSPGANSAAEAERRLWRARFDEVNAEIADRKQQLAELSATHVAAPAAGGAAAAAMSHAVPKAQIAQRERQHRVANELRDFVAELKEIDAKLRALDADG